MKTLKLVLSTPVLFILASLTLVFAAAKNLADSAEEICEQAFERLADWADPVGPIR